MKNTDGFAEAIKAHRLNKGHTIARFANEILNVDRRTLSNWEHGTSRPKCAELILRALSIDAAGFKIITTVNVNEGTCVTTLDGEVVDGELINAIDDYKKIYPLYYKAKENFNKKYCAWRKKNKKSGGQ